MDPFGLMYIVGLPAGACLIGFYDSISEYRRNRKHVKREQKDGWTYIGKVQFMCVYPIDGGRAIKVEQAYFGQSGLRTDRIGDIAFYDRGFMLYNGSDPLTAVLRDENLSKKSNRSRTVTNLWNFLKPCAALLTPIERNVNIEYLDGTITVHSIVDVITNLVRMVFKLTDNSIRIGYFPQNLKRAFNRVRKAELLIRADGNYFSGNYASFTMVNSQSVNDLRRKCGRADLSYKNFRPQVVFQGLGPYIEDGARQLKIGDLELANVRPCVHRNDINFTFSSPTRSLIDRITFRGPSPAVEHTEPFDYLRNNRQLHKFDAHFPGCDQPSFGINFECDTENEQGRMQESPNVIKKGYNVYARY